jgi:carbamoyl-phosphate synthase small subunit
MESDRVFPAGLVIRDLPRRLSNWRANADLGTFLQQREVVAIADIDTRRLTRLLREQGAQNGCIVAGDDCDTEVAVAMARGFPGLHGMDLAREVTTSQPYQWSQGGWSLAHGYREAPRPRFKVLAYDFGIKHNILRMLTDRACQVKVVPATTPAADIIAECPDGIFLSNGPGDPEPCDYAIRAISELLETDIPMFGICLGHQLLALASGAVTTKMKFGHHGANHPVQDLATGQVMITSQNHGFAVAEQDLPPQLQVTHRSLFDGSIQGIARVDKNAFSFQGHPEASPGPHDVAGLFDRFVAIMRERRAAHGGGSGPHA